MWGHSNSNHIQMQNIIKKCNLGIAVQEAMRDLDLEREKSKIMETLRVAFVSHYDEFKRQHGNGQASHPHSLKAFSVTDNEYPIGEKDGQQYFRGICFQAKLENNTLQTSLDGEKRHFTLIEGYSRNDDSKKRQHQKTTNKTERKVTESNGRKRTKREESARKQSRPKRP